MYSVAKLLAGYNTSDLSVKYDIHAAINLFERCIGEQNNVEAMLYLATELEEEYLSRDGSGMDQVIQLYERYIAESNDNQAKMHLAKLFEQEVYSDISWHEQLVRAVQLYDSCVKQTGNVKAMYRLAQILTKGVLGVKRDLSRGLQLYERCINEPRSVSPTAKNLINIILSGADEVDQSVAHAFRIFKSCLDLCTDPEDIIKHLCRIVSESQRDSLPFDAPNAVLLLEICVDKCNNSVVMTTLADILLRGAPQVERDVDRGLLLCATVLEIEEPSFWQRITDIARRIVEEPYWTHKNVSTAVQLCELCIEKIDDDTTRMVLAEIIMSGAPGVEKDVDRAMQLCKKSVGNEIYSTVVNFAKKIAEGTHGIPRNVPVAVQLCQMCIEKGNDGTAMWILAELYLMGAPGIEQDVDHAIEMFAECLRIGTDGKKFHRAVTNIAKKIFDGKFGLTEATHVATQLCGMCIGKGTDATLLEAELLLTQCSGVENAVERGTRAFEKCLRKGKFDRKYVNLVKKIAHGTFCTARNAKLAVQLCELCIGKNNDTDAMLILAEILMTGDSAVKMDVDRGIKLCKEYLNEEGSADMLIILARKIAYGRGGKHRDVQLAIRLCQLCIEEENDARSMMALAEILEIGQGDIEKDANRVSKLRKDALIAIRDSGEESYSLKKLVRSIAFGKPHTTKNVPFAIELCEIFVCAGHEWAKVTLGEILLTERRGAKNIGRGLQLFEESLGGSLTETYSIVHTARRVIDGKCGIVGNAKIARELLEMFMVTCDEPRVHPSWLTAAAEILIMVAEDSKDIESAVHLCQMAINTKGSGCESVAQVARNIAFGIDGMKRDPALAIKLCQMCIERKRGALAFMTLAEIFIAGAPEVQRNVRYATELCEQSVAENRHLNLVPCLARSLATGTAWMEGDAALAVTLCEMCVAKRRDVRAMVVLSEIYSMGTRGVKMDMRQAQEWYERAVDEGWLLVVYNASVIDDGVFDYVHGEAMVHTESFGDIDDYCEEGANELANFLNQFRVDLS